MVALSDGKQDFKCRDCGRQFVVAPRHRPISVATIMVDSSNFIRKDISGWDCEGDWGFGTVVAILCVYKKVGSVKKELEVS